MTTTSLDETISKLGDELWQKMQGEAPGVFNKDYWQGRILEWAMKDPSFKVDMFRFVDVLPSLTTKDQVVQHIKEYLLKDDRELPTVISVSLKAATAGLTSGIAVSQIKKNVVDMAERFIVGGNAKEAIPVLKKLHKDGIAFTVDLLGEATVSEKEADTYAARYLDLIDNLADETAKWSPDEVIDRNHLGPIPRTNVSLKISAMFSQIDPVDTAGSVAALKVRVLPLFLRAKEKNVFLNMDLEQWAFHDITYDLFEEIATHPELRAYPHIGVVIQAYLKSAAKDVDRLLSIAKRRGAPITTRLVKGAYWDYETVLAQQQGWPSPVFEQKAQTDAAYESVSRTLLQNIDHIYPAFGSHNLRSVTHALVMAREMKAPERAYEVQMLYGMAEPERKVFRSLGHRVRVYAPVGELLPGMAYLVRRLLENTSNAGFLKLSHHDGVDTKQLMKPPAAAPLRAFEPRMKRGDLSSTFENCPLTDWARADRREAFRGAVQAVRAKLPIKVPVVIAGKKRDAGESFTRTSPNDTSTIVAHVVLGTVQDADAAVLSAHAAYPAWRDRPLVERTALLEKLADLLEADRDELSAMQSFEVGKPWKEADADVAEAIDFCRYYARRAMFELAPRPQGSLPGEDNRLRYDGRGVHVVIAPWNFPLAILTGMATAALVAGNPVVMKPAEQSSAIAWGLYERMMKAGFPADVVQFLPGVGELVGPRLVEHPQVAGIAFTGSKGVGLGIVASAARVVPGQTQVKRVVCEMGGKNAIIIDEDADLDEAVHGVVKSAFGFAGQKCSACSRVIVVGTVYDQFVARLLEAASSLELGDAAECGTFFGPVVDEEAQRRLLGVIQDPGAGAERLYVGTAPQGGTFVPPAIFAIADPTHKLAQQELFGPVLAVMKAKSFKDAIDVANGTEFALTGAVYSRSPVNLDLARERFRVGNLYLNRGSTGALVERQPFGGFAMSGIGTKAGGPSYLLHFVDPRVVTENTMRRGFTPELES